MFKERPAAEPPLEPSKHRKVSGGHPNTQKQALGGLKTEILDTILKLVVYRTLKEKLNVLAV